MLFQPLLRKHDKTTCFSPPFRLGLLYFYVQALLSPHARPSSSSSSSSWRLHTTHISFLLRRREPQGCLSCGDVRSSFIVCAKFLVFLLVLPKGCNGKTKVWALCQSTLGNHMVFLPYWRQRHPPVLLRCPHLHSALIASAIFLVFISVLPNICNGKTHHFGTLPIYIINFQ